MAPKNLESVFSFSGSGGTQAFDTAHWSDPYECLATTKDTFESQNPFDTLQNSTPCGDATQNPFDMFQNLVPCGEADQRPFAELQISTTRGDASQGSFDTLVHNSASCGDSHSASEPNDCLHQRTSPQLLVEHLGCDIGDSDAEDTYRAGLKGNHGGARSSFAALLSVKQANALAQQNGIGSRKVRTSITKKESDPAPVINPTYANQSAAQIILSDLQKNHTNKTTISAVQPMTAKDAAAQFKYKFGDPAAEKKKLKKMAESSKNNKVDSQHPDRPTRKSDPIRTALAKPAAANHIPRPTPRMIRLNSLC